MENETNETEETGFAKELATDFARSLAVTVGVWGGIAVVGYSVSKIKSIRKARISKNATGSAI